ncbi:hypothetical protein NUSPORA_00439 [Nucleospora cyclopteri]
MENITKLGNLIKSVETIIKEQEQNQAKNKISSNQNFYDLSLTSISNELMNILEKMGDARLDIKEQINNLKRKWQGFLIAYEKKDKLINEFNVQITDLKYENEEMRTELEDNSNDFDILKELVDKVTEENELLKLEIEKEKEATRAAQEIVQKLEEESDNKSNTIKNAEADEIKSLNDKCKILEDQNVQLEAINKQNSIRINQIESQLIEINNNNESNIIRITELEEVNQDLLEDNENLIDDIQKITDRNSHSEITLQSKLNVIDDLKIKIQNLTEDNTKINKINSQLKTAIEEQKGKNTEKTDKIKEKRVKTIISSLNEQISVLKNNLEKSEECKMKEYNDLKTTLISKEKEIQKLTVLQSDIKSEYENKFKELKESLIIKDTKIDENLRIIDINSKNLISKENQVKELKQQNIELGNEVKAKQKELKNILEPIKYETDAYREEIKILNSKVHTLSKELKKTKEQTVILRNKSAENLSIVQSDSERKAADLKNQINVLEKELYEFHQVQLKLSEYQKVNQKLLKQLNERNNELEIKEKDLYKIKNELFGLKTQLNEFEKGKINELIEENSINKEEKPENFCQPIKLEDSKDDHCLKDVFDRIISLLSQGNLECDKRFLKMVGKTIKRMEQFEDPGLCKVAVQFAICRKYIEDVIEAKRTLRDYRNIDL